MVLQVKTLLSHVSSNFELQEKPAEEKRRISDKLSQNKVEIGAEMKLKST